VIRGLTCGFREYCLNDDIFLDQGSDNQSDIQVSVLILSIFGVFVCVLFSRFPPARYPSRRLGLQLGAAWPETVAAQGGKFVGMSSLWHRKSPARLNYRKNIETSQGLLICVHPGVDNV
jgi:hypothetical protein